MTARRIARELAVIVMPQLPKERQKLEGVDFDVLVAKAVYMLCDYAKQNLAAANAILLRSEKQLNEIEIEHPHNAESEEQNAVPLTSGELKEQVAQIERALELVAEALDIPEMSLHSGMSEVEIKCRKCDNVHKEYIERANKNEVRDFLVALVTAYLDHRDEIDEIIKRAKAKWQIERMVSIDRDILRLACAESFFTPSVPVNVAISEAVELSHRFADEKAAKFINGILGDLSEQAKHFRRTGKLPEDNVETGSDPAVVPELST
ncbi:MAG: transcription antitermination factor NusB [Terriglobales bacterium]